MDITSICFRSRLELWRWFDGRQLTARSICSTSELHKASNSDGCKILSYSEGLDIDRAMLHESDWMMQFLGILVPFLLIYEVSQVFAAD